MFFEIISGFLSKSFIYFFLRKISCEINGESRPLAFEDFTWAYQQSAVPAILEWPWSGTIWRIYHCKPHDNMSLLFSIALLPSNFLEVTNSFFMEQWSTNIQKIEKLFHWWCEGRCKEKTYWKHASIKICFSLCKERKLFKY